MLVVAAVAIMADPLRPASEADEEMLACYEVVEKLYLAEEKSGYQVENLLAEVKG
jgi:hypothetical protein